MEEGSSRPAAPNVASVVLPEALLGRGEIGLKDAGPPAPATVIDSATPNPTSVFEASGGSGATPAEDDQIRIWDQRLDR